MTVLANLLATDAIHWARTGTSTMAAPTFAAPVAITCRWEDRLDVVLGANRERFESSATVYTSTDVAPGDWLKQGTLSTSTADDPRDEQGAREVVLFSKSTAPLVTVDPVRKALLA